MRLYMVARKVAFDAPALTDRARHQPAAPVHEHQITCGPDAPAEPEQIRIISKHCQPLLIFHAALILPLQLQLLLKIFLLKIFQLIFNQQADPF